MQSSMGLGQNEVQFHSDPAASAGQHGTKLPSRAMDRSVFTSEGLRKNHPGTETYATLIAACLMCDCDDEDRDAKT